MWNAARRRVAGERAKMREHVNTVVACLLAVLFLAFLAGQVFGQPMLLGFVTSDSMEPTLGAGDGFVAVPDQLSGEIEDGDVIVFEAEELNGGSLTTHRVVGETEDGYVTKGDANPFTDQDGSEPHVSDEQVVATALQLNGWVVPVPHLGTVVTGVREFATGLLGPVAGAIGVSSLFGTQGVAVLLLIAGLALFAASFRGSADTTRTRSRSTDRDGVDGRSVVLVLLVLVLLPVNAAMIAPSGTHHVTADGDRLDGTVEPDERLDNEFDATNDGLVSMVVALDAEGGDASLDRDAFAVPAGESTTATLSAPAPPPGEHEVVAVTEHRYVLVLPESVLLALHDVHPLAAWGAINALLTASVLGLVGGTIGFGRSRFRRTRRAIPVTVRLKRLFR
ncbi:signal peptidase I [Natrialbaceae archaeon A-arb3/5]